MEGGRGEKGGAHNLGVRGLLVLDDMAKEAPLSQFHCMAPWSKAVLWARGKRGVDPKWVSTQHTWPLKSFPAEWGEGMVVHPG